MNDFERFRSAVTDEGDTITVSASGELDLDSVEDLQKKEPIVMRLLTLTWTDALLGLNPPA